MEHDFARTEARRKFMHGEEEATTKKAASRRKRGGLCRDTTNYRSLGVSRDSQAQESEPREARLGSPTRAIHVGEKGGPQSGLLQLADRSHPQSCIYLNYAKGFYCGLRISQYS